MENFYFVLVIVFLPLIYLIKRIFFLFRYSQNNFCSALQYSTEGHRQSACCRQSRCKHKTKEIIAMLCIALVLSFIVYHLSFSGFTAHRDVFSVLLLNLNTDFYWCSTIIRRKEQPLITATAQLAVRVSEVKQWNVNWELMKLFARNATSWLAQERFKY